VGYRCISLAVMGHISDFPTTARSRWRRRITFLVVSLRQFIRPASDLQGLAQTFSVRTLNRGDGQVRFQHRNRCDGDRRKIARLPACGEMLHRGSLPPTVSPLPAIGRAPFGRRHSGPRATCPRHPLNRSVHLTRCTFLLHQLATTVAKPMRRGSARLDSPVPLRAMLPIPHAPGQANAALFLLSNLAGRG